MWIIYQMHDLHVTGLYMMIFGHEISAIIFLIVTVNMEYHIVGLIARDFVFQTSIVSVWISFLLYFWWVICNLSCYPCQHTQFAICCNCRCKLQPWTCTETRIFDCDLGLGFRSSTGTQIFTWDPHICRYGQACCFTTAKLVSNY